jgi:hypothetical protein
MIYALYASTFLVRAFGGQTPPGSTFTQALGKLERESHDHAINSWEKSIKNSCLPRMWKRESH